MKWAKFCRRIGTTPWRDDAKAKSGEDPAGHKREIILAIMYIVECMQNDKARPNGSTRTSVIPQSAANINTKQSGGNSRGILSPYSAWDKSRRP